MGLGFLPQRRRVGRLSLQRAGKGIVGRGLIPFRLAPRRPSTGEDPLSGDEEVDVVQVVALRWVHKESISFSLYVLQKRVAQQGGGRQLRKS
jgi:hypothetical protein